MTTRRLAMLLALTPGIGGRSVMRIMTRIETLGMSGAEFSKLSPETLTESFALKPKQVAAITVARESWQSDADGIEKLLVERNVHVVTMADAHYPEAIEQFDPDPPGALFLYGNTRLLERRSFCVLSSRNTTAKGLEWIEKLTEEGVFRSNVTVTGHDRPEYQRSAIVPLRWGAPRILCLDRGMFEALGDDLSQEPFRAARLWRYQFDATTDLAISPFRPSASFRGINNQVRDRLVASLSQHLDFVEVSAGGNMERLARMGLLAGRHVRISDRSEIVGRLREAGAEVLTT